jgi:flagellar biosynthesis chaperone FliJ
MQETAVFVRRLEETIAHLRRELNSLHAQVCVCVHVCVCMCV